MLIINKLNIYKHFVFKDKLAQIFVAVDDFCLNFENPIQETFLFNGASGLKTKNRKTTMCNSEIIVKSK